MQGVHHGYPIQRKSHGSWIVVIKGSTRTYRNGADLGNGHLVLGFGGCSGT